MILLVRFMSLNPLIRVTRAIRVRPLVVFLVISAGFWPAPASALNPDIAITQYVQTVWRAPVYLPHDDVSTIAQTRDGYLWIGTVEGLARFDGARSVVFDKSNTPAIRNNWIRALREDREGRLWIGTFGGGLVCREKGRFVAYGETAGLPADVIFVVFEDPLGHILVGTQGKGLFRFEAGRFVREPGSEELAALSVRAMAIDSAGTLWVGTEMGLFRRGDGGKSEYGNRAKAKTAPFVRQEGVETDAVISLASTPEKLYAGTESGGLVEIAAARVTRITPREGLAHERVWSLAVDRDQSLWIGTDGGGLQRLSHGRLSTFSTQNGLSNDYVWSIVEDREGNLWIGTNGGGINQLRSGRVVSLTTREGLPSNFIWSILRTQDGSLYIGTEDAGLARLQGGTITTLGPREGLEGSARALLEDHRKQLWIGGNRGLFREEGGRIRPLLLPGLDRVFCLAEDGAGVVWIGTTNGLKALDGGVLRDYSHEDGLSPAAVNDLHVARDGSLWVGTSVGLWQKRGDRFVTYAKEQGLPSLYVTTVLEGPDGAIWAATRGGLARLHGGRFQSLTSRDGLADDAIMSALLDDEGGLWMGGNRGLFRVLLSDLESVLAGTRRTFRSRMFGLEDGMRSVEVNHEGSSRFKDPDGRLWFATRGGAASIPPGQIPPSQPPPVVIEEARADGRRIGAEGAGAEAVAGADAGAGPWRLEAGTRRLDIHFTALTFRAPSSLRLWYRLEGFDPDWVAAGPDRIAHYTNLPHGRYRFQVVAARDDANRGEPGAVADLQIAPRFHETWWFRSLAVVFLVLSAQLFQRQKLRRLGRQKAELERLVAARTAEVAATNAQLAQLVREDSLTGVANRRRLDEALDEEWRRAVRLGTTLALVLVDVDFFKSYNDRLGHPAGDACLKEVATAVAETCRRANELVARYGGEEFAVLLPGVTREQACVTGENLRKKVQSLEIAHPKSAVDLYLTISVGVASMEPRGRRPGRRSRRRRRQSPLRRETARPQPRRVLRPGFVGTTPSRKMPALAALPSACQRSPLSPCRAEAAEGRARIASVAREASARRHPSPGGKGRREGHVPASTRTGQAHLLRCRIA